MDVRVQVNVQSYVHQTIIPAAASMAQSAGTVWVVVLGDFGRSPRMQYHCLSLLQLYDSKIHVFAQTNHLQGILPELLAAKTTRRLNIWSIMQMCVSAGFSSFPCPGALHNSSPLQRRTLSGHAIKMPPLQH